MSTAPLTPTTELEAVNTILSAIGESEVSDLDDTNLSDVSGAVRKLREITRAFQAAGWEFNTDRDYLIARNTSGELVLPAGAIHMDIERHEGLNGVRRGNRLWNKDTHSFLWDRDVKVHIKWFLTFEDLPELARHYITIRAAREFSRSEMGDSATEHFNEETESRAWLAWLHDESDRADYNIFEDGGVAEIASRSLHTFRGYR